MNAAGMNSAGVVFMFHDYHEIAFYSAYPKKSDKFSRRMLEPDRFRVK